MRLTRTRVLGLALLASVVWSLPTRAQEAVAGPARVLLRWPPDGSRLPADVGANAPAHQRHCQPLDPLRADVGGRAGAPKGPGVPPLAEHGALLRSPLARRTKHGERVGDLEPAAAKAEDRRR